MNRIISATFLIVLFTSVLGYFGKVSAQAQNVTSMVGQQGTYIDQGYYGTGLHIRPGIWTGIGNPVTITCKTTTTCTVQGDMWIQNNGNNTVRNQFQICLYIDGQSGGICQLAGSSPSDATFVVGSSSQTLVNISNGTHTVQTFFWSQHGASVWNHAATYRVYTPQLATAD